ncbi:Uncharacterised protein [Shigella flexneri]|uniref:Uncharacterized protein n=1 Tax=Shigella flexneri TaxID=623 RepID=A0A658Z355_SHIFL|nr:Uncharacterised protein [Shigella flexneri]
MSLQAPLQHLLSPPVVLRPVSAFLATVILKLLQLLPVFLPDAQLCLVALPLLIPHTCSGNIQIVLLTQCTFFVCQLAGQLNRFFSQVVKRCLFLQLLLFHIQQRQRLNQLILTGQHTLFICRQLFPVQVADALLQGQKLFMRFSHPFSGNAC